jgi:hypothetical protein
MQFPRSQYQRSRERFIKYPLRSHQLQFLAAFLDRMQEGSQLKDDNGTIDFEDLPLIQLRSTVPRKDKLSNILFRIAIKHLAPRARVVPCAANK